MKLLMVYRQSRRGFSFIEVLVVLAVFSFLALGGTFLSLNSLQYDYFSAEERTTYLLLRMARSRALNGINHSAHGLFVTEENFILFQGNKFDINSETNELFPRNRNIQVEISTSDGVIFESLSANLEKEGAIIMISDDFRDSTIEINKFGRIN